MSARKREWDACTRARQSFPSASEPDSQMKDVALESGVGLAVSVSSKLDISSPTNPVSEEANLAQEEALRREHHVTKRKCRDRWRISYHLRHLLPSALRAESRDFPRSRGGRGWLFLQGFQGNREPA